MRVEGPRRRSAENGGATGKAGGRQGRKREVGRPAEGAELHPPSSCFFRPLPPPALGQEARARLGNLSVLSEMSAEINPANPPRWPVTLISLKFQVD